MSAMIPDLVVGAVGFGNNGEFYAGPEDASQIIAELRAENARLKRHRTILRKSLKGCAALTPEKANEKHEVLLETDPKNYENAQENP